MIVADIQAVRVVTTEAETHVDHDETTVVERLNEVA
jgi:hypothetical protein